MGKVVYNACYGGFGLSTQALDRMYELGYDMELNPNYNPKGKYPDVDWYNRTQKYKIYSGDIQKMLIVNGSKMDFLPGGFADSK